jgi:hypothetical protein
MKGLRHVLDADASRHLEPRDEKSRKLGDFDATCMDEQKAETASAETLREELAAIEAITDRGSLARASHGAATAAPRFGRARPKPIAPTTGRRRRRRLQTTFNRPWSSQCPPCR